MIDRRELLIGAGCAVALGTAEYLRPRRVVTLFRGTLETAVPRRIGRWNAEVGGDFIVPTRPGSLADRLYASQITRNYRSDLSTPPMMLVIAYGRAQSDSLQLHRPEVCYPAVGFTISEHDLISLPLAGAAAVPAVTLTAQTQDRVEDIVYWTRLGEYLPQTAGQQRKDRLATSIDGYIGDGILVRASVVRSGPKPAYEEISAFLAAMMRSIVPVDRPGFIGSDLSKKMLA